MVATGDIHEQEADRVVEAMVSAPAPRSVPRACTCEGGAQSLKCSEEEQEGPIQRKTDSAVGGQDKGDKPARYAL